MRILVADDEASVRETLRRILECEGHEVTTRPNGDSIVRGDIQCDMLVTDIVMPGIEGLETIRHVRQVMPHIGIIAISGSTSIPKETYLGYAEQFGADCILTKPFYPRDLLAAIRAVCAKRNLPPEPILDYHPSMARQADSIEPWQKPLF